jgi:hypothetical protein
MNRSRQGSFAARGFAVLQSLGGWVAIQPEQTYVATSIRGLGACKSTFCPAERRELPVRRSGSSALPLLAALAAAAGILTACASDRPFGRDVTSAGRFERAPEDCQVDCQNRAAPVSEAVLVAASVREAPGIGDGSRDAGPGPARAARDGAPRADGGDAADRARRAIREAELVAAR